jgi:hypothetical protein
MTSPRVYADFQNLDDSNRVRLTCAGTVEDLSRHGVGLKEGMVLTLYTDDADDQGRPDELQVEGVVRYNAEERCWVAAVDWSALRHASQAGARDTNGVSAADVPSPGKTRQAGREG